MPSRLTFLLVTLSSILCAIGCDDSTTSTPPSPLAPSGVALKIAVIPKGTTHVFWKSVQAGAEAAGVELGVEIVWKGPLQENDRAQQIQIVERFASDGISGIVLAPLDFTALKRPVSSAMGKGIPVVVIDSALDGEAGKDFVALIATDNKKAGAMGGAELARIMNNTGNGILVRYMEGSASTMAREAGALESLDAAKLNLISKDRYAGATMDTALTASMQMADKLKEAQGIFTPNESSTAGMLQALRQMGLAGKVKLVGFDTSPMLVEGLEKGEIQALVAQDPYKMGYLGVKNVVAKIRGEVVETNIDTGAKLVTKENLNSEEIQALVGKK